MIKIRNESGECPCYICPEVFDSKKNLRLHSMNVHRGEDQLKCPQCNVQLKDISTIRRHIKTVHLNVKQYVCCYCEKRYAHKFDLEKHFLSKHKVTITQRGVVSQQCPECKSFFESDEKLNKHMSEKHQKTVKNIKCPYCIKIFFDSAYLKQHLSRVHANREARDESNVIYTCKQCQFATEECDSLWKHVTINHSWDNVVFCPKEYCSDYFKDEEGLKEHSDAHPNMIWKLPRVRKIRNMNQEYRCYDCNYISNDKVAMITHITDTHQSYTVLECQWCSSFFSSEHDLYFHKPCKYNLPDGGNVQKADEDEKVESEDDSVPTSSQKRQKIIPFLTYKDNTFDKYSTQCDSREELYSEPD